jgi:acyl-CoA reductase-like NAD-dependent aldehyde dehydrogenase
MTDTQRNVAAPYHAKMLIGGESIDSANRIEVKNPARPDELVGTVVRGTPKDVDAAVAAAKAAQPGWGRLTYVQRAAQLEPALAKLEQNVDERAALYVRENGKTFKEAKGEHMGAATRQRLTLAYAPDLDKDKTFTNQQGRTFVTRRPYGVVVSIVPWNAPIGLAFIQVVSMLLAGNAVVVKPPESCPLALIRALELFASALPKGLVNIVTGMPAEIGDRLTTHPDVGKIGFTGSIASARTIMANAAQSIKGVTLELGGNDPAIVLDDADISEPAMERMAGAVFRMTGQVCMAIKRVYVPESIHDKFVDAFSRAADKVVVGDGLEPKVTMGPLHTEKGRARARSLIDDAKKRGATVREYGQVDDAKAFERGWFMRPMVVTNVTDDAPLMVEEQFCPALPIARYTDLEQAIARANDSIYGLGASVWGKDVDRCFNIGRRIESGTVWINTHGTEYINRSAAYGGVKQSGIGRKAGLDGVLEYSQMQTLTAFETP